MTLIFKKYLKIVLKQAEKTWLFSITVSYNEVFSVLLPNFQKV